MKDIVCRRYIALPFAVLTTIPTDTFCDLLF